MPERAVLYIKCQKNGRLLQGNGKYLYEKVLRDISEGFLKFR